MVATKGRPILGSLWFRLIGAFAVVIAVMLLVVVLVTRGVTERQFDQYLSQRDALFVDVLVRELTTYYEERGSWDDVEEVFAAPPPVAVADGPVVIPEPADEGESQGAVALPPGLRWQEGNGDHYYGGGPGQHGVWDAFGLQMVLVDSNGTVITDSHNVFQAGESLDNGLLAQGKSIQYDDQVVGTLVALREESPAVATARTTFLWSVTKAVGLAVVVAGGMSLLLGTLIFIRVTRPLREIQRASHHLAAGDLTARVPISTKDELSQVADSFNQMASQLENQQRLRKQMIADIAHELRTPISVFQGTLEGMLDGVLKPEPSELHDLHDEARRLARLVEELRTLSLAEAGQLRLKRQPVDLGELSSTLVQRMSPLAQTREVAIETEIREGLPLVSVDADRIVQVLTNLLDNALRYTPAGGQVTVRVSRANGQVQMAVEDQGPGIPEEQLPYVFERFWRGDRSRSRDSGGSGLGLAIARQLVELHGGTIAATSQMGKGSTFWIALPTMGSSGTEGQGKRLSPPNSPDR
jgi:two-component system sensor histidine kinase BaeS